MSVLVCASPSVRLDDPVDSEPVGDLHLAPPCCLPTRPSYLLYLPRVPRCWRVLVVRPVCAH